MVENKTPGSLFDYNQFLTEVKQGLVLQPLKVKILRKFIRKDRAILWLALARVDSTQFLFPRGKQLKMLVEARLALFKQVEEELRKRTTNEKQ